MPSAGAPRSHRWRPAISAAVFIANEGFDPATAGAALAAGEADAIAFGKLFISDPDLPERIRAGAGLAAWNADTFYTPGAEGYVDYPRADPLLAAG